jgi:hypothetical protein
LLTALLIPTTHHLGAQWEEDLCDFLAVTEGLGRFQVLTRWPCAAFETDVPRISRSILLLPCPGESHQKFACITVLDRAGLEQDACGCHRLFCAEYRRLQQT